MVAVLFTVERVVEASAILIHVPSLRLRQELMPLGVRAAVGASGSAAAAAPIAAASGTLLPE